MLAEERDHLAADLQFGDVGIQIDTIQALEVEHDVATEDLVDIAHRCHTRHLRSRVAEAIMPALVKNRKWLSGPRLASLAV
jgi:hypothetical protein